MKTEVQSAVDFLTNLLSRRIVGADKVTLFSNNLEDVLCTHFKDHWFPEKPNKGSGYRCIRIVNRKMDPLLARAGASVGLSEMDLLDTLPSELTLWVDPEEVSYRIGEDGSIGVLFENNSPSSQSSDSDFSDSDSSGSLSSSPSPSQEYLSPFQQQVCRQTDYLAAGLYSQPQLPPLTHWEYLSTFVAS